MAKKFESKIQKPSDAEVLAAANRSIPFGVCTQCGQRIAMPAVYCGECERLLEIGFGPFSRAPHALPGQDTQPPQSFNPFRHDGYQDTIPNEKFPPGKERM